MADYTQTIDFSDKDALASGQAAKVAKGVDIDDELGRIATAIATKYDSVDLATQAQAQAGTLNTVLITPLRAEEHVQTYVDENGGLLGELHLLADPGGDRIIMWDDGESAGSNVAYLTVTNGLEISGTSLGLRSDVAGTGLSISSSILALSLTELGIETSIAAGDFLAMVDITDNGSQKITFANLEGALNHDNLAGFVAGEHILHTGVDMIAGTGLTGGGTIETDRTFNVIGGAGITANANDIVVDVAFAPTWTGDHIFNNSVDFGDTIHFTGVISPSSLSSNQNNWAPTGAATATIIRIAASTGITITGFSASQTDGRDIIFMNISSSTITFTNESGSSDAANRFTTTGSGRGMLAAQAFRFVYDGTTSRWQIISD